MQYNDNRNKLRIFGTAIITIVSIAVLVLKMLFRITVFTQTALIVFNIILNICILYLFKEKGMALKNKLVLAFSNVIKMLILQGLTIENSCNYIGFGKFAVILALLLIFYIIEMKMYIEDPASEKISVVLSIDSICTILFVGILVHTMWTIFIVFPFVLIFILYNKAKFAVIMGLVIISVDTFVVIKMLQSTAKIAEKVQTRKYIEQSYILIAICIELLWRFK